jgi:hypothetical protein
VKIGPNSPKVILPPLPPSTTHLAVSQVLITLSGLGSQLGALPPVEELDELASELASEELDELASELASEELELTTTSDEELELTATSDEELELTATSDEELELTATELTAELTTAELAAELTTAELTAELTAVELELLFCFLLSLPPQALKRTPTATAATKCFTIAIISC